MRRSVKLCVQTTNDNDDDMLTSLGALTQLTKVDLENVTSPSVLAISRLPCLEYLVVSIDERGEQPTSIVWESTRLTQLYIENCSGEGPASVSTFVNLPDNS